MNISDDRQIELIIDNGDKPLPITVLADKLKALDACFCEIAKATTGKEMHLTLEDMRWKDEGDLK